ncbi:hypothetical protein FIBSPDRAFT_854045 [Athelia psychrophila]|uniref:Uncharacterized protein n=1 Tax=Athelia psychrophila TaxID=1759441 RepID=A0A166QJB1_9AGAM|nr:hypothetical protein FIBSPDRAFT_854045 [Fibularhizoctonia sp. CBS 109695]
MESRSPARAHPRREVLRPALREGQQPNQGGGGQLLQEERISVFGRETLKSNCHHPPETQLCMGQVGGILVPIGLFVLTFTTYASVPWAILNYNYRAHPHSTASFGCLF